MLYFFTFSIKHYYLPGTKTTPRYLERNIHIQLEEQSHLNDHNSEEDLKESHPILVNNDMVVASGKARVSPPTKASTKAGVKSVKLTMGLENTNISDVLKQNSHSKILEWLQNKNLGR